MKNRCRPAAMLALLLMTLMTSVLSGTLRAQSRATPQEAEMARAVEEAVKAATRGPATVKLIDEGSLSLPEGYLFTPQKEAAALMLAMGNRTDSDFVGLIFTVNDDLRWFIEVSFTRSGYVRDDEAKNWNAEDLLIDVKRGTEAANQERVARGFPAVEVVGWIECPNYDANRHLLIWSMLAKDRGATPEEGQVVNYNTYALGRNGFFKLTLVTPDSSIADDQAHAQKMLESLHYDSSKRYEDFVEGRDNVATYGIAALVAGAVAKKTGFLAVILIFLAKIWKVAIFAALAFLAKFKGFFANLLNRKKTGTPTADQEESR
ncbi:MAG TPA: DUF2167 domain-containing protein [Blastocatellia bacterium]|nr:DUF2167 domain-containing protein [Blastocatellia bacterium]